MIDLLLKAIPDSDENCNLKRAEVRRWYQIYKEALPYEVVGFVSDIIQSQNVGLWNDNKELNSFFLGERILDKFCENEVTGNVFDLYRFACLFCSEKHIRNLFDKIQDKNKSRSIEKLISSTLGRYDRLMKFWSHYIHVVDEEGEYVENPNQRVLSNFKSLLSDYGKDFDVCRMDDLRKCGFECAKRDGSREALEFFWKKLENQYGNEKEKVLKDIGINDYSLCRKETNRSSIIGFCLKHLGAKMYAEEAVKTNKWGDLMRVLIDDCLYKDAELFISFLRSEVIQPEHYHDYLIYYTLQNISEVPSESVIYSSSFFSKLWCLNGYAAHRDYVLNNLNDLSSCLVELLELGVLAPCEEILTSASEEQVKKAFYVYEASQICSVLYNIKNATPLLQKIGSIFIVGMDVNAVIDYADSAVQKKLNEYEELKCVGSDNVFTAYKKGKEEFIRCIQSDVPDSEDLWYKLMGVAFDVFDQVIKGKSLKDVVVDAPSHLSSVKSTSLSSVISK